MLIQSCNWIFTVAFVIAAIFVAQKNINVVHKQKKELHQILKQLVSGEGGIRTLGTVWPVRQFSKLLVSASHPPHHVKFYLSIMNYILANGPNSLHNLLSKERVRFDPYGSLVPNLLGIGFGLSPTSPCEVLLYRQQTTFSRTGLIRCPLWFFKERLRFDPYGTYPTLKSGVQNYKNFETDNPSSLLGLIFLCRISNHCQKRLKNLLFSRTTSNYICPNEVNYHENEQNFRLDCTISFRIGSLWWRGESINITVGSK